MIRPLAAAVAWIIGTSAAIAGCGADPAPCVMLDGEYELAMPDIAHSNAGDVNGMPAVMFLHGAGGSGRTVMGNRRLITSLVSRGYAVIAPTGSRQFRNGKGFVWNFYPGWEGRDAGQFIRDVADDASTLHGLDRDRILLAGFSAGGFMVNYLACDAPASFAAYAPASGGFWRPHPENCKGPVKLFHTHGWSDKTVPLEGRVLGNGRFEQGDIFAGLEIWRAANRCDGENPESFSETGAFWRRKWGGCAADSALEMALFQGGHTVPKGWGGMVLDWFETQ